MSISIETVNTGSFSMDYFRFGKGKQILAIFRLYMYVGYGMPLLIRHRITGKDF